MFAQTWSEWPMPLRHPSQDIRLLVIIYRYCKTVFSIYDRSFSTKVTTALCEIWLSVKCATALFFSEIVVSS